MERLIIRRSVRGDVARMMEVFAVARGFMRATGNPNQWADDYPSIELLHEDIRRGDSYVVALDGRIVATFVLRAGEDPTYAIVYDGAWKNSLPYATIHRIASSGEVKGVFRTVMDYAIQHFTTIRIDTHADNHVMRHIIEKAGFEYCGIINCWNGDERLAFQLG